MARARTQRRGARTQDTATAFAGYGTGNRTPALVRYKNESINRLVIQLKDVTQYFIAFCLISWTLTHLYPANISYYLVISLGLSC